MSIQKIAQVEKILEVKSSANRLPWVESEGTGLSKFAALDDKVNESDGYLYVRARAISSRVNKNNDGWPSEELANAYETFVGRPIFVDHNNDDPRRARGVIVDSTLHVEDEKQSALDPYYSTAPDNHKPPTWIELLLEVDAKTFPKLATAVRSGDIDAVSMGANIEKSVCSVCAHEASTPSEYCNHIKQKGLTFEITSEAGEKVKKKAYEDCFGVNFFEISFVFDPADETALISEKTGKTSAYECPHCGAPCTGLDQRCESCGRRLERMSADLGVDQFIERADSDNLKNEQESDKNYEPQSDMITAPQKVDTLRDEMLCPICKADDMTADPDGIVRCPTCGHVQEPSPVNNPDLSQAGETDLQQNNAPENEEGDQEVTIQDREKQISIDPIEPVRVTKKNDITDEVIGEMWKTVLRTDSRAEAEKALETKTGAVAETTIEFRGGIHGGTHAAFKAAGITATVTYPVDPPNQTQLPGANPMIDFQMMFKSCDALQIDKKNPGAIPITVESDNLDQALEIIHSGGFGAPMGGPPGPPRQRPEAPAAPPMASKKAADESGKDKKAVLPDKKPSDEPADQRVVGDQLQPVESSVKVGDTVTINGQRYTLADAEDEMEKEADRRTIKREEREDGEGITRSEVITEEVGEQYPSGEGEPVDESPEVPAEEPVSDDDAGESEESEEVVEESEDKEPVAASAERSLFAALEVAELQVELGLIDANEKLALVAQIEDEAIEVLEARKETLSAVKEAGLSKKPVGKLAGVRRVPRLSHHVASTNGNGSLEEIPDEAIFNS